MAGLAESGCGAATTFDGLTHSSNGRPQPPYLIALSAFIRSDPWQEELYISSAMTTYFTDKSFRFMRALARNNERIWFTAHKADYEAHVREPFQRLIGDLQPALREVSGTKTERARRVGQELAARAKEKGITAVVFDRGGFLYHGRVKALADGAREGGLEF